MSTYIYDPKKVTVTVGLDLVSGFAKDQMVEVFRNRESAYSIDGITGSSIHVPVKSRSGMIRIHLHHNSPLNKKWEYSLYRQENEQSFERLFIKIGDRLTAAKCLISRLPNQGFGRKTPMITWEFSSLEINNAR